MKYKYRFKYRRVGDWFWRTESVVGHKYDVSQDKMVLYFENMGIREIAEWRSCECMLGSDWALAMKRVMEESAGISIPVP